MPLSEFLQKTVAVKSKAAAQLKMSNFSSGPFSFPDHELAELLWENGQIVTQEHANRPGKNFPNGHSNQSDRTTSGPKNGQPDTIDPFGNALPNGQDDEMVPWISYPVEEPLRTDFCSDLLEEFAGGTLRLSSVHDLRNSGNVQPENASKAPTGGKPNLLFHSSQQCQSSDTTTTTRVLDMGTRDRGKSQIDPSMELANTRNQNPPSTRPARSSVDTGFVNFSLFSRPIMNARDKPPIADRMRGIDKSSALVVGNPLETKFVDPISSVKHATAVRGQSASGMSKLDSKLSEKHLQTLICVDQLKAATERDALRTETNNAITIDCNVAGNMASTKDQAAKGPEATVASSSLCSVNDAGVESSDPKGGEKRKSCEREESSSNHSEDLEDESVGAKRPTNVRRTGSKRSRAAEVHNLSERRRRERINEKMRALQELIPNCNKADKASMLEDAIEYLKSLQQQVQLLSMGGGMYMPSMMLPPGMEHMRPPHMYPFVPMGVGMGMGMGMGFGMGMYDLRSPPGCPIVPVSPMQRLQFSCPSVPPPPTLHGLVGAMNHQVFGATGMGVSPSAHGFPQFGSSSDPATRTSSAPEIPSLATVPAPSLGVAAPVSAEQKQESKNLEAV